MKIQKMTSLFFLAEVGCQRSGVVPFSYLNLELEPVAVRLSACPSFLPFMCIGWTVLELFVVGNSLKTVVFITLFGQSARLMNYLLSYMNHNTIRKACSCLYVFNLQARREHVRVCEKLITFAGACEVLYPYIHVKLLL